MRLAQRARRPVKARQLAVTSRVTWGPVRSLVFRETDRSPRGESTKPPQDRRAAGEACIRHNANHRLHEPLSCDPKSPAPSAHLPKADIGAAETPPDLGVGVPPHEEDLAAARCLVYVRTDGPGGGGIGQPIFHVWRATQASSSSIRTAIGGGGPGAGVKMQVGPL